MNILYDERVDGALPKVDKAALLAELQRALPDLEILHRGEDLKPYECDGLSAYRTTPMLVVLPERVEQVETLLKLCHQRGVPVVARGAGTGLSGGALPLEQGILLVMARFNKILEVDPAGRFARVQPGVRNLAISQAAAPHELYYAPDPSSQIACSIGGNVAENAGGVHCLKYGLTVHNLLKVEILTVEGERMTLGSDALDSPGFDLLALFTGSEGMLGIVTEVTVKLLPKPQVAKVLLAAFDSVEKAGRAVGDIIAAGILGDVAADGAGDLRGRVGGVIQIEGRGGLGDRQVAYTGLDPGEAPFAVDFENLIEARHHQQNALLQRQCPPGQAGAGTACHHRHATGMAKLEQLLDLLDALGQHHQHRRGAVGREAVALVRLEIFLGVQDVEVGQVLAQLGQQRGLVDLGQCAVDALVVQNAHGRLNRERCFYKRSSRDHGPYV